MERPYITLGVYAMEPTDKGSVYQELETVRQMSSREKEKRESERRQTIKLSNLYI